MAWEWVSPVATASAGVVAGGIGVFFTWLTGKQSRDHAEETLREQLGHERLQAREAREQERLATAYLELLRMAERVGQWAQMVYPVVDTVPSSMPDTPLPSLPDQAETAALVNAYGSAAVREKWDAWEGVVRQMITQAELTDWEEHNPTSPGDRPFENSPRGVLYRLRPQEAETRRELADQVSAELRFGYRSTRKPSEVISSYTTSSGQEPPSISGQEPPTGPSSST
ncbi:MAG: hypothetical protein ACXVB5_07625 [Isosphaeraceae bacterium]